MNFGSWGTIQGAKIAIRVMMASTTADPMAQRLRFSDRSQRRSGLASRAASGPPSWARVWASSRGASITITNPWVDIDVENIDQQVHHHVNAGGQHDRPLDKGIVTPG